MRYHTLLYAGFLPATVLAQSTPSAGTGFAHSTGATPSKNGSATWYRPIPVRHSSSAVLHEIKPSQIPSNSTIIYTERTPSLPSQSKAPHKPFTKSTGFFFSNATSGVESPTRLAAYVSGTGTPQPSGRISSGFAKPTSATPFTETVQNFTAPTSSSGRLPFSSGSHFINETSTAAPLASATVASSPSGTGVSSGFAKPTAPSTVTSHAQNTTIAASATIPVRLPLTKGQSNVYRNNTSSGIASSTNSFDSPNTAISSGFAKQTGGSNYTAPSKNRTTSGRKPCTRTRALFLNSTSIAHATKAPSTGLFSASARPTTSGHPSFPKSSGAFFANSTSGLAPSLSSLISTGLISTWISKPVVTSSPAINSTSVAPLATLATLISSAIVSTSTSTNSSLTLTSSSVASATVIAQYYQCGGLNWNGSGDCAVGTVCKYWNPYYSQCVYKGSA